MHLTEKIFIFVNLGKRLSANNYDHDVLLRVPEVHDVLAISVRIWTEATRLSGKPSQSPVPT